MQDEKAGIARFFFDYAMCYCVMLIQAHTTKAE